MEGVKQRIVTRPQGKAKEILTTDKERGNGQAMKIKRSCKEKSMIELLISSRLASADMSGLPVQCQFAGFLPVVIEVFAEQWRQHFPVIKQCLEQFPHQRPLLKPNRLSAGWEVLLVPELEITTACSLLPIVFADCSVPHAVILAGLSPPPV